MTNLMNPFTIDIDPMERLLLINIENDADEYYVGFEPQVFNDPIQGEMHLIIAWRKDGMVDVYHQKSFQPDPAKYSIAGKGLACMQPVNFRHHFFSINDFGVHAHYYFIDFYGRTIEIRISEKNYKKRRPFGLLAPMGDAAENPLSLPLILLHDFYFVRKRKTFFSVSVNGRMHKPDALPMPIDWSRMYFTRYCPAPLIATLNPASEGILKAMELEDGSPVYSIRDYTFELDWNHQKVVIKSITRHNERHPLKLHFEPAFPSISDMTDGDFYSGTFSITGHHSTGSISGTCSVKASDGGIQINLQPDGGWKPVIPKFSLLILYTIVKVFKHWPRTYKWTAELTKSEDGCWYMSSRWVRIGRP
jgi:hypothetical protein